MSQDEGAERSHEATPQKLQEARKKGELVKSQDVAVSASYMGVLLALILIVPQVALRMSDMGGWMLQNADRLSDTLSVTGGAILAESIALAGLLIAPAAALVLIGLAAQQAFVVAPSKLAPKLSRISILANAGNKFGPSGLFEFAKSAAKLTTFGGLLLYFLVSRADRMVAAAASDPRAVGQLMTEILFEFTVLVALVSGTIAVVDYFWQRHTHLAKNRMTRQEVIDEMKQSDGDPAFKAKRRQRAQEIATNRMMQDVPDATVIIVNPTHYAVALKWSPMDPSPPVCLAKGVDEVAARIRAAATEAGVPIFSDPPTARALHATVEVGDAIEREHFAAVAAAIRFARSLETGAQPGAHP